MGRPASQKARNRRPEPFYLYQIACLYFKEIFAIDMGRNGPGQKNALTHPVFCGIIRRVFRCKFVMFRICKRENYEILCATVKG
jgi:hypothetical protein